MVLIPEVLFFKFIRSATEGVEFSFKNTMYSQVDGVSMGSPLSPVLANIFVDFHEEILFKKYCKAYVELRYVDETFSINDAEAFNTQLYSLHSTFQFTMKMENICTLSFFGSTG